MVTIDDARLVASNLSRSYEAVVRDQLRFRVGQIVYVSFSRDETLMGFAFPKQERDALVASEPNKFLLPRQSELRFNWVGVRLDAIDHDELHELIVDAWRMVVPKKVSAGGLRRLMVFERRSCGSPPSLTGDRSHGPGRGAPAVGENDGKNTCPKMRAAASK
jgi:hypothetical protein